MLGKLLKKDLKSTYRLFIPLLCGYGVASVLGKILFEIVLSQEQFADNSGFFNGITIFTFLYMGLFIIYLVACYLMTSVFVIYDFYKTMVSDHGYPHPSGEDQQSYMVKDFNFGFLAYCNESDCWIVCAAFVYRPFKTDPCYVYFGEFSGFYGFNV